MGLVRNLTAPKPHPETGDLLSFSERFSWNIQKVIRRWAFVFTYTALSWWWWWRNGAFAGGFWHDPSLAHWNVVASLAALQIESAVGIVVIRQMIRDRQTIKGELEELKVMHLELSQMHAEMQAEAHVKLDAIAEKVGV